jgi:hypothetical protein
MSGALQSQNAMPADPNVPSAMPARGDSWRNQHQQRRNLIAHKQRCKAFAPPSEAELTRMVAEFLAGGGTVKSCSPAHAMAIQNGAGRDAVGWTT